MLEARAQKSYHTVSKGFLQYFKNLQLAIFIKMVNVPTLGPCTCISRCLIFGGSNKNVKRCALSTAYCSIICKGKTWEIASINKECINTFVSSVEENNINTTGC